ncbi:MAG: exodeoxyribonuclease VII large subunit, partial [Anaerolineales bacterium]|nr:exodeoxyribonuclease VII large subunit [Anaerolineales bacterium]
EVHGSVSVYEIGGQYQLYADSIRPVGEGLLYQEFLRLKAQLEAEGLFDQERKRPIPASPRVIGIVTSPTGAALRDMLNTLRRRFPLVEVVLAPASVQGDAAPDEIVAGIKALNRTVKPDVIIVGRGGGSIEDLWAFNDPDVARAIAASVAPVISGVGHETDFTIAGFVADLRAPTPTAAAELATPDQAEVRAQLTERVQIFGRAFSMAIENFRWELNAQDAHLQLYSPVNKIRSDRQRLDERIRRADRALIHQAAMLRSQLEGMTKRLDALSPRAVLARGYAVVSQPDGALVRSPQQVSHGDKLSVEVADGRFGVEVSE